MVFEPENIAIWETSARGIEKAGETIRRATDTFMTARATGVRGVVIENKTGRAYRLGEGYYQHTKRETIQGAKKIALYMSGQNIVYLWEMRRGS